MKLTYRLKLDKSTKNKIVYADNEKGISFYIPKADLPSKPPAEIQMDVTAPSSEEEEDPLS
jgi:hypothetical protein